MKMGYNSREIGESRSTVFGASCPSLKLTPVRPAVLIVATLVV
jgi:hypothetical protein